MLIGLILCCLFTVMRDDTLCLFRLLYILDVPNDNGIIDIDIDPQDSNLIYTHTHVHIIEPTYAVENQIIKIKSNQKGI